MNSSEEQLKEATKELVLMCYEDSDDPELVDWMDVVKEVKLALAASEQTDLEKLRKWLLMTRKSLLEETPRTDPYDRGYLNALATVRDYITTQLGEEDEG